MLSRSQHVSECHSFLWLNSISLDVYTTFVSPFGVLLVSTLHDSLEEEATPVPPASLGCSGDLLLFLLLQLFTHQAEHLKFVNQISCLPCFRLPLTFKIKSCNKTTLCSHHLSLGHSCVTTSCFACLLSPSHTCPHPFLWMAQAGCLLVHQHRLRSAFVKVFTSSYFKV